jgi:hypothetical protein
MAKYLTDSNDIKIEEVSGTNNIQLLLNNITEITGSVTVEANQTIGYAYFDFPEGYTLNNSVIIYNYYQSETPTKNFNSTIGASLTQVSDVDKIYVVLVFSSSINVDQTYDVTIGLLKKE